ncbi:MAG: hypothetical protein ABUS54_15170 [Actinomycetota bacterium]
MLAAPPTCATVPPALIKSTLGLSVPKPKATQGAALVCTYGTVIVRFQTGESKAAFTAARKQFDAHGEPTKTYGGLGVQAYSSVIGSGTYANSTVVALKGSTEVLVTAQTTVAKVAALVKKVLALL